jgi:hypothetical protein
VWKQIRIHQDDVSQDPRTTQDMRLSLHVVTNIVRLNVRVDKLVDKNVDTL